jgi:hypothetical protein
MVSGSKRSDACPGEDRTGGHETNKTGNGKKVKIKKANINTC